MSSLHRRDAIAGRQDQDIAHDDILGVDVDPLTIPA